MGAKPLKVDLNDLALSNLDDMKVIITHSGKVIYDSVPGGAGHSIRLVTSDGKMLYSIFKAALERADSCSCKLSC